MFGYAQNLLLVEAHEFKYSTHLGSTKMYNDLKLLYWWSENV